MTIEDATNIFINQNTEEYINKTCKSRKLKNRKKGCDRFDEPICDSYTYTVKGKSKYIIVSKGRWFTLVKRTEDINNQPVPDGIFKVVRNIDIERIGYLY